MPAVSRDQVCGVRCPEMHISKVRNPSPLFLADPSVKGYRASSMVLVQNLLCDNLSLEIINYRSQNNGDKSRTLYSM